MKKALAIVFTLLILLPILSKTSVFIWFKANQNYIASNLCINKDSKEIPDCEGCCVLNEQLKKVEDNSETNLPSSLPKDNKQLQEYQWIYCMGKPLIAAKSHQLTFLLNPYFSSFHKDQYLAKINKPPCWINSFI
jgi:hypothetical protein